MEIPILQILVSLIFVLLGFEVVRKPPTSAKRRWFYTIFFIVLGCLLLTLTRIQYRYVQSQEAEIAARTQTLEFLKNVISTPLPPKAPMAATDLPRTFDKETSLLESNQADLQQKYQGLLSSLATHPSLDPNLREQVVVAKARLEAASSQLMELKRWEQRLKGGLVEASVLKQIQLAKESGGAQAIKDKVLPYFDDAVNSLAGMSGKEAMLKGDESISTYAGLSQEVSPEAMAGKRFRTNVAEIKFRKNDDFKMEFVEELTPDYEAEMNITCKGGILFLRSAGYLIETRVEIFNGQTFGHEASVGAAARKNIADSLEKLMAAELNSVGSR